VKPQEELARNDNGGDPDVLSGGEEGVVSMLRQIVNEIRAHGLAADVETVARAAVEAGATSASEEGWGEAGVLTFHGTHFSLILRSGLGAGIEVNFHTEQR